jgi:hypothetical protein
MAALPSALDSTVLSLAERMAAHLDGELYALGAVHCPIDEIETPALRLAGALAGRPSRLIAELDTAAWVWGALPVPPARFEFCVDVRARARPAPSGDADVREVVIADGDLCVLAGRRVTTPLRTALDIARARAGFGPAEAQLVRRLAALGGFGAGECRAALDARRNLPAKRRARERLEAALCGFSPR